MNNYTKLLTVLTNMDEMIKEKDKTLILLSPLPDDEYETFVLTLINGKSSLNYDDVSAALMNHELRRKDKKSSNSTSAEILLQEDGIPIRRAKEIKKNRSPSLIIVT